MTNIAIIAGAGKGARIGNKEKSFLLLNNKPLLSYSLETFDKCDFIDQVIVVVGKDRIEQANNLIKKHGFDKDYNVVEGGNTRQESVYNAIKTISAADYVLVHDAARPLISFDLVKKVFEAAKEYKAVIPAIPASDTMKLGALFVISTLNRDLVWQVQTPQGFEYSLLKRAYEFAESNGFLGQDDSSLVERMDYEVKIIIGNYKNMKITYPLDLMVAEKLI
ncbi:MAG: 2-C-methyl-D-erythritol 4-phosphate cytidylyltransferase [Nanoarchaeota archaeon]|nr:2-C-methyl-D-erythritol 4-phosphate cytidylyltransferase [Nanoarchaeota archaeon]MBU1270278.1 2-C-methyl-D-erythritol 4-phosphate cytidylyltransferase [Nanoarchaeota archaeon]MBU1604193.1 2-C-methyl-D-erythritol 4-phosphate cytidylyltransferase [Nanoarchaeota archaeon]MBU2443148.1 2-C-methyl-D-erythritol 4-phosphate cytidylyltransferase [Nanoarchaeota archaeon]